MEASSLIETLCSSTVGQFEKDQKLFQFIHKSLMSSSSSSTSPSSNRLEVVDKFLSEFPGGSENSLQFQNVKLKLADTFRRSDLILDLLHHGNRQVISKAVKLSWLYRDPDINLFENCDFLLQKFFPTVSFSCRLKVVNNMSKFMKNNPATTGKIDQIFDAIQSTYGYPLATPLLVICSPEKIESVIKCEGIMLQFTNRQLLTLARQFEDLVYFYFKKIFGRNNTIYGWGGYERYTVYNFLFDQNPIKFTNFLRHHPDNFVDSSLIIGRKRVEKALRFDGGNFLEFCGDSFFKKFSFTVPARKEIWRQMTPLQQQNLIIHSLPRDMKELSQNGQIWQWLTQDIVPGKDDQLEVLRGAISKKYGCLDTLMEVDSLKHLSPEIIALLPPSQKLMAVDFKLEQKLGIKAFADFYTEMGWDGDNYFNWTALKPTQVSIEEFKKMLLSEQLHYRRIDHLKALLMTCYLNEDAEELLTMIKYCQDRVRNDQPEVRNQVIDFIAHILVDRPLTCWTIGENHWLVIMDMIRLSILQKDVQGAFDSKKKLVDTFLLFLFKKSRQNPHLQSVVQLYLKLRILVDNTLYTDWVIPDKLKALSDQRHFLVVVLEEFVKNFPKNSTPLPQNGNLLLKSLIKAVFEVNQKIEKNHHHPEPPIPIWTWLLVDERLDQLLLLAEDDHGGLLYAKKRPRHSWSEKVQETTKCQLSLLILKNFLRDPHFKNGEEEMETRQQLFEMMGEKFLNKFYSEPFLTHFLKVDPTKLAQCWDTILRENCRRAEFKSEMHQSFTQFLIKLEALGYQKFVDEAVKYFLQILDGGGGDMDEFEILEKTNAIRFLSVLSSSTKGCPQFLQIISKFYPTDKKLDPSAEHCELDLEMKGAVASSLKNLPANLNPPKILEAIQKFCLGDFLKFSTGSLYSALCLAPQEETLKILKDALITVKAVSFKKHLIRSFFTMASVQEGIEKGREILTGDDQHVTSRYEIFIQVARLFVAVGSRDAWSLLEMAVQNLKNEDKLCLEYLSDNKLISKIPPKFMAPYLKLCLSHLKEIKLEGGGNQAETNLASQFAGRLESIMDSLDEEILAWIICQDFTNFRANHSCDLEYCAHQQFFETKYLLNGEKKFPTNFTPQILQKRLTVVINSLTTLVEDHWHDAEKGYGGHDLYFKVRGATACFVLGICSNGLGKILGDKEKEENDRKWVGMIFEQFLQFFETKAPLKCFKQIFNLKLALILVTNDDDGGETNIFKNFGKSTAQLVDSMVRIYGGEIVGIISETLKRFWDSIVPEGLRKGENILRMLDGLLDSSNGGSVHCQIVAAKMMPTAKPDGSGGQKVWDDVHLKMEASQEPVANIYRWAS